MNFTDILNIIYLNTGHAAVLVLSLSVLICATHFKKLSLPYKRLFYFLIFNLLIEIASRICVYVITGINNLPLLHLYTLGEFILLLLFYNSLISKPRFIRSKFLPIIIGGSLLIILNSLLYQSIYEFNPLAKSFVQIVIISLSVLYFYNLSENKTLSSVELKSLRLINSAILIYYSGSLFIFMWNQIFFDNSELYRIFWAFNAVLNLIFQLLILWGIWKMVSKKARLSS